jgi:hypothetical protein
MRHYLKALAQTLGAKWQLGAPDESFSDKVAQAPADDVSYVDVNPYQVAPAQNKPDASFNTALTTAKNLVNQSLQATNKLLSLPKYQTSKGLQAFKNNLPQLLSVLNSVSSPDSEGINQAANLTQPLSFYSDPSNAGTGFDATTHAKDNVSISPAHNIPEIERLINYLKTTTEF